MLKFCTLFLQAVVVLAAIAALGLLLWEPQLEGRNAHATQFQIYFQDPFLAYAYTGAIAVFVALFKTFRLLGYVRQNRSFSPQSIGALKTIKLCALTVIGFVVTGEVMLLLSSFGESDDRTGGVAMGLLIIFASAVVAAAAALFEKILKDGAALNPAAA
ncbi:MAG: DUF2975 domain-containing protein [Alphaproteobacteria bacterium]|nr:DUF2975 domain-containing protein [Alphaproteobacteria bacterium]